MRRSKVALASRPAARSLAINSSSRINETRHGLVLDKFEDECLVMAMDYEVALAVAIVGDEEFGQGFTVVRGEWHRLLMVVVVVDGRTAMVKRISDNDCPDLATQPVGVSARWRLSPAPCSACPVATQKLGPPHVGQCRPMWALEHPAPSGCERDLKAKGRLNKTPARFDGQGDEPGRMKAKRKRSTVSQKDAAPIYGSRFLKQIVACRVIELSTNMSPFRTKPNAAFKIAQSLPMLIGSQAEVRNCSVPFIIPRILRGSAGKSESPASAADHGIANESGKLRRFAPSAYASNCGCPGPSPSFGRSIQSLGAPCPLVRAAPSPAGAPLLCLDIPRIQRRSVRLD